MRVLPPTRGEACITTVGGCLSKCCSSSVTNLAIGWVSQSATVHSCQTRNVCKYMYVYRLVSYAGIILGISVWVKHQVECLDFITPMHTRVDRAGADQGREEGMGSARQNAPMHADPHSERCALFMHRQLRTIACHIIPHSICMHPPSSVSWSAPVGYLKNCSLCKTLSLEHYWFKVINNIINAMFSYCCTHPLQILSHACDNIMLPNNIASQLLFEHVQDKFFIEYL